MGYNVIFNKQSLVDLQQINDYLFSKWGISTIKKFHKKLEEFKSTIVKNPQIGVICVKAKEREIRQYPVTKQNLIIYSVAKTNIRILRVFDTRQHPDKKITGIK